MRKFLALAAFLAIVRPAQAIDRQSTPDYYFTDAVGNISISTSAWTAVPASNSVYRLGIIVQEYASNSANMLVRISSTTTAPAAASNIGMTLHPTDGPQTFSISDGMYLFAKSQASTAENLFYQELK